MNFNVFDCERFLVLTCRPSFSNKDSECRQRQQADPAQQVMEHTGLIFVKKSVFFLIISISAIFEAKKLRKKRVIRDIC